MGGEKNEEHEFHMEQIALENQQRCEETGL